MIVRDGQPFAPPFFYAACLACGWCGSLRQAELAAGRDDDNHLAAKLAARGDRRGGHSAPLTPAAAGSVASPCPKCNDTGMIPDPDRGSGWGPYWDTPCDCGAAR